MHKLSSKVPNFHFSTRCITTIVKPVHNTPSVFDLNRSLIDLSKTGKIDDARKVFDKMLERDEFSWNTMIGGYASSGRLIEARQFFDEIPSRNSITWSSMISGCCRSGYDFEALEFFREMGFDGHTPNQYTLGSVLRVCSKFGLLFSGEQIHGYAVKTQYDANVFVVSSLVGLYVKCNCVLAAERLFETVLDSKNNVLWTTLLTGYSQNGYGVRSIEFFRDMRLKGVEANQFTFPSILTACSSLLAHGFGLQVHGCIIMSGFEANVFVKSALVDMYAKCGDLISARKMLAVMNFDDVIAWNSMIVGCVRQGFKEEALSLFVKMHARNMKIDDYTYPSILTSFVSIMDMKTATSVHSLIIKTGFEAYTLVSNALVDMYAKHGDLSSALEVFSNMTEKDVISWTSLVTGYAYNDSHEEALKLFCDMRMAGIYPDQFIFASILSACAELTILELGQQVHAYFSKFGLRASMSVDNSLVSMYAKCGCIEEANKIFDSMHVRGVITWTALIVGYAQNGKANLSINFYEKMIDSGVKPDYVTFIGLLFACSHAGLVEKGHYFFESMEKTYGVKPGVDHYACMIDLLGRSGKLVDAENLLNKMGCEPDATVWKSLLAACRVHKNIALAERAASSLFKMDPTDAAPYVLLCNIYLSSGRKEDALKIRNLMKLRGVSKEPGCSWIETNSQVHTFMAEDKSHPQTKEIYSKANEIMVLIKKVGYVPDTSFVLHDIGEKDKEFGLAYHSEKLAIAFGLLVVPQAAPIRIFKNLRVCGDCHSAIKFMSGVFQRHIILRDAKCFHHFRDGKCSCGDFW